MPTNRMRVTNVDVTNGGEVIRKLPRFARDEQVENSMLGGFIPDARIVRISIPPTQLDLVELSRVLPAIAYCEVDGVRYRAVGGTSSKSLYGIEEKYEKFIQKRFRNSPQNALTYFGILVSACKVRIKLPRVMVKVVEELTFGTNDSRGWIRRALFNKLRETHKTELLAAEVDKLSAKWKSTLPLERRTDPIPVDKLKEFSRQAELKIRWKVIAADRFYQFRLALETIQAKGGCKIMEDDVADQLKADIIIPVSCMKPGGEPGHSLVTDAVFGVREVSEPGRTMKMGRQVLQYTTEQSLQTEMATHALAQAEKLRAAYEEGDYTQVLELLGTSKAKHVSELEQDSEYTSTARTAWEALLQVDPTGHMIKFPYVNRALNRSLGEWGKHLCMGAGVHMPCFHLCDDGFLALHKGKVIAASDWIPDNRAITSVQSHQGLVVRPPVRMREDLLPYTPLAHDDAVELMSKVVEHRCGVQADSGALATIVSRQVAAAGTFVLNSKTFKLFCGDGDGDYVAVVEGDRFPLFVESRVAHKCRPFAEKSKQQKRQSPWWELANLANQNKDNNIGLIDNLISRCVAAEMIEEAYLLVGQLQRALDRLKWGTELDWELINRIREIVPDVPWLALKDIENLSGLPLHLDVLPTDKIGWFYNLVRQYIAKLFPPELPIGDFFSLISGQTVTDEMVAECRKVREFYIDEMRRVRDTQQKLQDTLTAAQREYSLKLADYKAQPKNPDLIAAMHQARKRRNNAQASAMAYKKRKDDEISAIREILQSWADGRKENRRGWCQAMHMLLCKGNGGGGLMFTTFGQEFVDMVSERVGSTPVEVFTPNLLTGRIEFIDGGVFFIEPVENNDGSFLEKRHYLQSLPLGGYSEGKIGDGTIVLNDVKQRPRIQRKEAKSETSSAQISPTEPSFNSNQSDRKSQQLPV